MTLAIVTDPSAFDIALSETRGPFQARLLRGDDIARRSNVKPAAALIVRLEDNPRLRVYQKDMIYHYYGFHTIWTVTRALCAHTDCALDLDLAGECAASLKAVPVPVPPPTYVDIWAIPRNWPLGADGVRGAFRARAPNDGGLSAAEAEKRYGVYDAARNGYSPPLDDAPNAPNLAANP